MRAERDMNPEVKARSVYVSALSWNTNDDMLREHMSKAGEVVNAVILRRERSHRSLGCGVVEYKTRAMALHAVATMNDTSLDGRMIHCREDRDTMEVFSSCCINYNFCCRIWLLCPIKRRREMCRLENAHLTTTETTRLSTQPKCT